MAEVFKDCLEMLISMKTEFAPNQYPLAKFESVSPEIREDVLRKAENKFNYSNRTIFDFYGYLFEVLNGAGLSEFDGTEAAAMYVVYRNAMSMFPQFAELPFKERISLLRKAHRRSRRSERNLNGCAMNVYLVIVESNLDCRVNLQAEEFKAKGSYESPWRVSKVNPEQVRSYVKDFQNFKNLSDYDTGQIYVKKYPVWTSYKPTERFKGVKRNLLSFELWNMLATR